MNGVEKLICSVGRAYQQWCAGAEGLEVGPDAELMYGEFVLQQIITAKNRVGEHPQADVTTDIGLSISEIEQIVSRLKRADWDRQQLQAADRFEEEVLQILADAKRELSDTSKDFRKRQSEALRILGLIGNEHNEGSTRAKSQYEKMASHYEALRSGNGWHGTNGFVRLRPHSHKDAVKVIENMYDIGWRDLQRNCRIHEIWLNKGCERYPIK